MSLRSAGAERISKHIKHLLDLIPLSDDVQCLKTRALSSTRAIEASASIDDFLTHGSWISSLVFDTFYQLLCVTAMNFTHLAPSAESMALLTLDSQSESVPAEE